MNAQNFTQKTLEMIQTAKSMAMENNNQYITPVAAGQDGR